MKNLLRVALLIITGIFLAACGPSANAIETAIAQTQVAKPSNTQLPLPTDTPLPTATLTPEPTSTPELLPFEERIIGKWSGMMTNASDNKLPATWTFLEGGILLIEIGQFSYGAEWSIKGNRIHIISELDPENPTYRDIEHLDEKIMVLVKSENNIKETWKRVEE